jgi:hypothetical protein
MNKSEVIFEIFSKKLNSLVNPKFQNVFIRSLFSVGVLLITPKLIGILARLEIITHNFIVKLEVLESNDTTLSLIGAAFIIVSVWLFKNERALDSEAIKLEESKDEDIVINYYVCENYERLVEVNNGDLSNFPVAESILHRNSVMSSLNKIISYHPKYYRHANHRGGCYKSVEEYSALYKDASKPCKEDGNFSYFQVLRKPRKEELISISNEDGLLKLMLEHDTEYPMSIVGGYKDECCGIDLQEEFVFRQLWVSFLVVTNNTDKTLQLSSLSGEVHKAQSFYPLTIASGKEKTIDMPNVMLSSGKSMVIPLAVLMPPLYSFQRSELSPVKGGGDGERVQKVKNESIYLNDIKDCLVFGDKIDIKEVRFKNRGKQLISSVRKFDLTNMFTYNLHWQCGSCPHLFFRSGSLVYVREIIAHCQNKTGNDNFIVPEGVTDFVIAEIEAEVTHINSLEINNEIVASSLILKNGDQISFSVKAGDFVNVTGKYIPDVVVKSHVLQGVERNKLVGEFLRAT